MQCIDSLIFVLYVCMFSHCSTAQELLGSSPDTQPVVFFRSVSFTELESLVDYIYRGSTQVENEPLML